MKVKDRAINPEDWNDDKKNAGQGAEAVTKVVEDAWPKEIELLLYSERPGMAEGSCGVVVQSLVVIGDIEE